jgi:hypothetical protein
MQPSILAFGMPIIDVPDAAVKGEGRARLVPLVFNPVADVDGCSGAGWHQDPRRASRHSALSYEHAGKIETRLKTELMAKLRPEEAA